MPTDDGGSRIHSFIIEAREKKRTTWHQVDLLDVSEMSLKVERLIENNSYFFRVSAKNNIGVGEALYTDRPVVISRPPGAPDTPFPLLVSDIQLDNCTLEWKAPTWTGGEELQGYIIEMRIGDSKSGQWIKVCTLDPTSRSHTVRELSEGEEYYFRISAFNNIGSSKPLVLNRPVIPKKKLTPPSVPTGPITPLTCDKESITIQWGPPKHDGGSPVTRYVIFSREVNKPNWNRVGVADASSFSYQIEHLTENSDYHFRVVAENNIGQSEHVQTLEPIKARSPYDVPSTPEGPLVVTNITDTSATVSWKKPLNDGGSPIVGYLIKRRDIKRPVWVKCGRVSADSHSVKIKELVEGYEYAVQVFAENSEGLSIPLETIEPIIPKRPIGPPSQPASLECIGANVSQVTLQWETPLHDGGAPVQSYRLEMCEKGKNAKSDSRGWKVIKDDIAFVNTSYCVQNLEEGHEYLFRLSAINENGVSEPKVLDKPISTRKMVESPGSPNGPLVVKSMDSDSITIGWSDSTNDGGSPISNYVIEVRDVLKASWNTVGTVTSTTHQYTINNLIENNDYFIRVRAQNEAGLTSHPLESNSFITVKSPFQVPSAPRHFKLVSASKDTATFEFTESENDGGLDMRCYIIEKRDSNRVTWVKAAKIKAKAKSQAADGSPNVYTCVVEELTPGTSMWFRILAENQKGRSESCDLTKVVNLEKDVEEPSKPLDLFIVKQKNPNAVLLEWKPPLYNGNDHLNEYVIEEWSSETREWRVRAHCAAYETSHIINELSDDAIYKFRVRASNKKGVSEPSLETFDFKVQKDLTIPNAPQGPLKTTISDDQTTINLEWSKPKSDGGSKIKRYIIEKKKFGFMIANNEWYRIGFTSSAEETSFKLTEYFIEESSFSFRIIAENEVGKSAPLELSYPITLERKKKIPEQPSYLRVKEKTASSVTLVWKSFAVDSLSYAEKYLVEKREKNSKEWTRVGHTKLESFTVNDLDSNSSYFFRIIAVNSAGESEPAVTNESISMDITNDLPSIPLSISVDDITQNSVNLSWISPKNSGTKPIIGYKIYRLAVNNRNNHNWEEVGHVSKTKQLSYVVNDLDHRFDYKFRVCAFSELGVGKPNESEKIHMKKPIGKFFIFL